MNYSEYIKSRYGFVEGYEVKGEELLVTTPDTKKDKPHKFEATKENTKYFDNRLGNQYRLLINHQEEIVKDKTKKARGKLYPIATVLTIFAIALRILNMPLLYPAILFVSSLSLIGIGETVISFKKQSFRNKMLMYKDYIENRREIEEMAKQDKNIVEYLNEETVQRIKTNEELQQQKKIEDVFNIDLMDRMSLEQLKELLTRYKISQKLYEDQIFIISEESKPKTKSLTQNNK